VRATRTAGNRLAYEATIADAKTFQDEIVLSFAMAKVDARKFESACHEGNYSLPNALFSARQKNARRHDRYRPRAPLISMGAPRSRKCPTPCHR